MALTDYWRLTRPVNCFMAGLATWTGYWLSAGRFFLDGDGLLVALAALFVCAGGQAINDFFDAPIDRKSKSDRPIPSGRVSRLQCLIFSAGLFIAGIILAFGVKENLGLLAIGFSVLLVVYSAFLGRFKVVGNWVVAFGTAFTFIFGAMVLQLKPVIVLFASSAFLVNVARELIKDLEDAKTDAGSKKSMVHFAGVGGTQNVLRIYILFGIGLAYAPLILGYVQSIVYVLLISIANWIVFNSAIQSMGLDFSRAQRTIKMGMVVAMLAFLSTLFF